VSCSSAWWTLIVIALFSVVVWIIIRMIESYNRKRDEKFGQVLTGTKGITECTGAELFAIINNTNTPHIIRELALTEADRRREPIK